MQAARDNIKDPPGIFVKVGLESLRGTLRFINDDLPRAFSRLDDMHILGDLADASTEADHLIERYIDHLEKELAPKTKGSFRLGPDKFEQKLRLDEGLTLGSELLDIAMRELRNTQEEFRRVASRMNGGDPLTAWAKAKEDHPGPGELVPVAQQQLQELSGLHSSATTSSPSRRANPCRWRRRRASTAGRSPACGRRGRSRPSRSAPSTTSPTSIRHGLPSARTSTCATSTMGRSGRSRFMKSSRTLPALSAPAPGLLEAAQVDPLLVGGIRRGLGALLRADDGRRGFRRNDPAVRLGQLAEALIRLCRFIVGIRLHCEDMSVEQGVRFFREEAFLEETSARREAERGSFDPSYIVYSAGKLMLLKLREDYKATRGAKYSLKEFHDTLLGNGTVPLWLHRALMLGEDSGSIID